MCTMIVKCQNMLIDHILLCDVLCQAKANLQFETECGKELL